MGSGGESKRWRERGRGREREGEGEGERREKGRERERERVGSDISLLGYTILSYYAVHVSAKIKQIGI